MPTPPDLYDRAFFEGQRAGSRSSALVVLEEAFRRLGTPTRIVDVGCGVGAWLRAAGELGAGAVRGIDGDWLSADALEVDPRLVTALDLNAADPAALVLFPEMDAAVDVPEITEACWGILGKTEASVMCSSSRMVVRRRGAERAAVVACTLLPYEAEFELGATLAEASRPVALNHPHCAKFCVLGGAACSR